MRRVLNLLYAVSGVVAAAATVLILVVVFVQVGGRSLGFAIRGADDLVAWLTASACLAGVGYAASQGSHVRVDLVTNRLSGSIKRTVTIAAHVISLLLSSYAAYACVSMVIESYLLGEVSQGDFPVKLWIPQSGVAIGVVVLAVSMADQLAGLLRLQRLNSAVPVASPISEI